MRNKFTGLLGVALSLLGIGKDDPGPRRAPAPVRSGRNGFWTRTGRRIRETQRWRRFSYERRVAAALREIRGRTRVRVLGYRESWEHAVDRGFGRREDPEVVAKRIYGVR